MPSEPPPIHLVLDVANVLGSRPDGWWRDRAGAAGALLARFAPFTGTDTDGPDGATVRLAAITAVLEGRAKTADVPADIRVVLAPHDGDTAIVEVATAGLAAGERMLVATADRGLRERLPTGIRVVGPDWANRLIGR
ncbi:hypothetical protein [Agromyces seonyuensis]|uniref:NYN domain-containing protein n=1 Tax=Agromyces seonyuensis TaxID=2662446 RepID=A0A6I4P581_9MICO|nr:hypothetical protein [Agromyces seonyuensis]MWC00166.1 hypothetical protein [Agromyces seonyuensis]